jgi:hypothetical protein
MHGVHGVHTPESENKALNKETLEYVVDDELSDLRALNSTVHEILREFERCLDRHPQYVTGSSAGTCMLIDDSGHDKTL